MTWWQGDKVTGDTKTEHEQQEERDGFASVGGMSLDIDSQ